MRQWAAVAAGILLLASSARAVETKTLPEVTIEDAHGTPVRLAQLKGRVLLVDFWASWCIPCKAAFPALDALAHEYAPKGAVMLAINVDERRKDADAFLTAHPHSTMTLLFDPKGKAPEAFGVAGMPSSFVIDRAGLVRFSHMGYTDSVAGDYRHELDQLLLEK